MHINSVRSVTYERKLRKNIKLSRFTFVLILASCATLPGLARAEEPAGTAENVVEPSPSDAGGGPQAATTSREPTPNPEPTAAEPVAAVAEPVNDPDVTGESRAAATAGDPEDTATVEPAAAQNAEGAHPAEAVDPAAGPTAPSSSASAQADAAAGAPEPTEQTIEDIVAAADNELLELEMQIDAGEYAVPKAWLEARVTKIEKQSHHYDPRLVKPYTLLGDIASKQGNYSEALDHYGHAVHIQRVNNGLVSAGQVDIVHREADTYRQLGDIKSANEREEYAYFVLRRTYNPYDLKLLPGVFRLADWYAQTNNVFSARALYQHSVDILTANGRGNSVEAIPALAGIAKSYRLERFPPYYVGPEGASFVPAVASSTQLDVPMSVGNFPQGERALQQIVQIRRDTNASALELAESVLDLADWYLLFEKSSRATPLYDYAYDLLDAEPDIDAVAFFAEPRLLNYPAPGDPVAPMGLSDVEPRTGYVEVRYEVTPDGFTRSLRTTDSAPKNMMDFRVRKSLRLARFRPALVDGVPVGSPDQTFRHEFTYYPSREMAADEQANAEDVQ